MIYVKYTLDDDRTVQLLVDSTHDYNAYKADIQRLGFKVSKERIEYISSRVLILPEEVTI